MAWWTEIQSESEAEESIRKWYGAIDGIKDYAKLAAFLSNKGVYSGAFEQALESLSKLLWVEFGNVKRGANRLSRVLQVVGAQMGFLNYVNDPSVGHVVYLDQITKEIFLSNVKNKVLWKDSFGFGHGEFTHSYQWLAAGIHFGWGYRTAELYSGTVQLSQSPMLVLGRGELEAVPQVALWQWLVDCVTPRDTSAPRISTPDQLAHHGHCFTDDTYRYANKVQTFLEGKPDWFIGYYASHRRDALDSLTKMTRSELITTHKSAKAAGRALGSENGSLSAGQVQRAGLHKKYKEEGPIVKRQFDTEQAGKESQDRRFHGGMTGEENIRIVAGKVVQVVENYRG